MKVTRISLGRTINMGNYESLRLEVSVEQETNDEKAKDLVDRALLELNEQFGRVRKTYK